MKAIVDKEKVKEFYLEGKNIPEIAALLNLKNDTVKKCIQRNFADLKLDHKRIRYRNKQVEQSINSEATKYMSDETFIRKNPSIYRTDKNGDIVVNAPEDILPWDVPRKYKNDNSTKLVDTRIKRSDYKRDELFG